jgi:paraquat-inducible protein B
VVDLSVRYDAAENHSVVAVLCELNRNVITDEHDVALDVTDRAKLQDLIDHGLRAQLGVVGLATGLLFVELDFVNPREFPAVSPDIAGTKYAEVPAVRSAISEYQASFTVILNNLKKVDFAGLAADVKNLLATAQKQLDGADVKGLVGEWKDAGSAVKKLAASPDAQQAFANLNLAVTELRGVLAKLDRQVAPAGENLAATLKEAQAALARFNAAAAAAQQFIEAQGGLGDEAAKTLRQLGDSAAAVQRLADYLERNPSSIITGKKDAP